MRTVGSLNQKPTWQYKQPNKSWIDNDNLGDVTNWTPVGNLLHK